MEKSTKMKKNNKNKMQKEISQSGFLNSFSSPYGTDWKKWTFLFGKTIKFSNFGKEKLF